MSAGWPERPLRDLCSFHRGLTYAKGDEVEFSANVVLRATNIDLSTNTLDFAELRYISDAVHVPESKRIKKHSLLICTASGSKAHLGKVAYIDNDYGYAFGGFMGQLIPNSQLLPKFLFHVMTSDVYKAFIATLSDGANINNLKFDDLGKFVVPVPPVSEQHRIAAILDDAVDEIATAKDNTEKNLQNAREVFESHLNAVFSNPGADWQQSTIGEQIQFIDYRGRTPEKTESGIRLITAKNVRMGFLRDDPMEYVAPESYEDWMTRGIPKKGDVLFTTEAPLGYVAQLDTDEKVVFAQRIIIMQPEASRLNSSFLKYMLMSLPLQQRIREKGTGATATGIKASLLRLIPIAFPKAINAQSSLARRFDLLEDDVERLEAICQQKLDALEELKKSLLHQAFSGEL